MKNSIKLIEFSKAQTKEETKAILLTSVACVDKICFLRPADNIYDHYPVAEMHLEMKISVQ